MGPSESRLTVADERVKWDQCMILRSDMDYENIRQGLLETKQLKTLDYHY